MSHLLYASNEMFSSTQLIRKSKDIFDKLSSNTIGKAVILRDGKPNFMLLDFNKYERIMTDYKRLQDIVAKNGQNSIDTIVEIKEIEQVVKYEVDDQISNEDLESFDKNEDKEDLKTEEEEELKKALAQIEALNLEPEFQEEAKEQLKEKSTAQIKEFWN